MDLIKIHERAKKADINIDIWFRPKFGGSITVTGRTIADDFGDTECYSRVLDADEVNYLTIRGEDALDFALDEVIRNLRPEIKMDWVAAEQHLQFVISLYQELGMPGVFGLVTVLRPLEERFLDGERTRELYDEIMELEYMVNLRDNLFITAGARAIYMETNGDIVLPGGVAGEDELAEFVVEMVDCYIDGGFDEPFDIYIEKALLAKFGGGK